MASVATYLVMSSSLATYLVYIPHASSHYNYLYPIVCLQLRIPPQATRVACAAACRAPNSPAATSAVSLSRTHTYTTCLAHTRTPHARIDI